MPTILTQNHSYAYPFPAVTLAYFLRYPNPYSKHVLSTDTIERSYDPATQQLTTVRLHLKRSKLPSAVLKLLPRSFLGANAAGDTQSYILERSVVDVREGRMETESRNLEWTGVLSVVERARYTRPDCAAAGSITYPSGQEPPQESQSGYTGMPSAAGEHTDVESSVTLQSRIGRKRKSLDDDGAKPNFLKSWSTASLQRSIELIGLKRARRSQPNATEGMKVVLERLRTGGLVAVLDGMRRDREAVLAAHGRSRWDGEE